MATATDEQAFLRAICECPDNDTPRLVFADWLDEHDAAETCRVCGGGEIVGDYGPIPVTASDTYKSHGRPCAFCPGTGYAARAEFIRVQCELARLDLSEPYCNRYADQQACDCSECRRWWDNHTASTDLRARERELLTTHQFAWFALPTNWQTATDEREADGRPLAVVSRGFVSKLSLPAAAFTPDLAEKVFRAQPVTAVVLSDLEPTDEGEGWAFPDADGLPEPVQYVVDRLHRTREAAVELLSAACVAWARGLVGPPARGLRDVLG